MGKKKGKKGKQEQTPPEGVQSEAAGPAPTGSGPGGGGDASHGAWGKAPTASPPQPGPSGDAPSGPEEELSTQWGRMPQGGRGRGVMSPQARAPPVQQQAASSPSARGRGRGSSPTVRAAPPVVFQTPPPVAQAPPPVVQAPPPVVQAPPPAVKATPPVVKAPPPVAQAPPPVVVAVPAVKKGKGGRDSGKKVTPPLSQAQSPTPAQAQLQFVGKPAGLQQVSTALPSDTLGMVSVRKGLGDMSLQVAKTGSPNLRTIPPRKNLLKGGVLGRPMIIDTNHLALDLTKMTKQIYHYDVDIQPDHPKRLIRSVMAEFKRQFYPQRYPAFDGKKNLYASTLLPFGNGKSGEIVVTDPERDRTKEFKVTVKQVGFINMESLIRGHMAQVPQTAVQALDIILRSAPANRMVQVGRSFFTPPQGTVVDLGDGMESWLGFFQSAIIGWKPFINIDVAHKGFPKVQACNLVILDLFPRERDILDRGLSVWEKETFLKYIRELKVEYVIPGQPTSKRTYRVNNIALSAKLQYFEMDGGRQITVQQYYQMVKKYNVKYPNLPCLDVGSPNREKKILVPCELCTVIGGQVVIKKMTETQTSALIKIAATSTDDRRRKIQDAMRRVDFQNDPSVKEFGLRVNDQFERIQARVLDPPQLQYKAATRPEIPRNGVWRNNSPFLDGKELDKWTVLSLDRRVREDSIRQFVDMLCKQARSVGMTIAPPQMPIGTVILPNEFNKLRDFLTQIKGYQLVFVIVQDSGNSYAKIKQMAELTVGVLTQCLKSRTLSRMNPATCGNILLKVNAKLNGCNHTFGINSKPECLKTPCMIVGADVTHPSPDQTDMPSVAAVCASHEPKAFKYNLQYRLQPPRTEIIEDLENIMKIQLEYFYKYNNGRKPNRIIFYRDGVSEGEFQKVLNKEFQAIRRACQSMDPDYEPKITFLVVQKRHHTRFFPTTSKPEDNDGRNKNVPAGTIVDTVITHPTDLDFYLVSHASIQGVSRPTKYRRLWDDSDFSEDELETLTYYLCHMFTRCTRSVSYPAPTYYAHLAAYRARCYIDSSRLVMNNLSHEQDLRKIKENIISESPMFFV